MDKLEQTDIFKTKIVIEQIRLLYKHLLPILAANIVVGSATIFGLWKVIPQSVLIIWFSILIVVVLLRAISYFYFLKKFNAKTVKKFEILLITGSTLTGLLWGLSGVILFPEQQLDYQLFILFVLVGMGAGSISSLTSYLPAFFSFFPISMLPICFKLLLYGDPIHLSLSIMAFTYVIVLSYFALNINRTYVNSLRLRFENNDLLEQLREQKNQAELANISKTKFLAAASHDLRQPLHALALFTSVLDGSIKSAKNRKVVKQIKASVNSLQKLFNALLDISRLEAGVMKVKKTTFYLQNMFDILANDFDPLATEKNISIHWPKCDYAIFTDQGLFEQILRNYISNAIRYTQKGNINIEFEVKDNFITINVIDTGIGIAEHQQQIIFQEFKQLNNQNKNQNEGLGLGLGLAIVQRSAKLLGHEINIKSQPNTGATFSITVNISTKTDNDIQQQPDINRANIEIKNALIIVIDDDINVLEGTQHLFEQWGCEVLSASNLTQVSRHLEQLPYPPDGIIADYRLQYNQTGIEAINIICEKYNKNIPAVIVTGDIESEQLRKTNKNQLQVLHKPVPAIKFRTFLRNVQCRN